jgi:hypothetical protein
MARFKPDYKVHRNKLTGDYFVVLIASIHSTAYTIKRGVPSGTNKAHYYTNGVWYPTLRDAIFSLIG